MSIVEGEPGPELRTSDFDATEVPTGALASGRDRLGRLLRDHPIPTVAGAFALGFLLARVIRRVASGSWS
jgi:hypothetical protein